MTPHFNRNVRFSNSASYQVTLKTLQKWLKIPILQFKAKFYLATSEKIIQKWISGNEFQKGVYILSLIIFYITL